MKMKEIHLRGSYILTDNGKYYMYGTRMYAKRFAELGYGFDVYPPFAEIEERDETLYVK